MANCIQPVLVSDNVRQRENSGENGLKVWLPVFFLILLSACAAPTTRRVDVSEQATKLEETRQLELAVSEMVEEQKRISRIHRTLSTRASELCGELVGPSVGFFVMRKPKGDTGPVFEKNYGVGDLPTVLFALEGSPAEAAGFKQRDVIKSVNGVATTDTSSLTELYEKARPEDPLTFVVDRAGSEVSITVKPERACRFPITLDPQQVINAFADGKQIMIARGMVSFARDENELALVIAHEMAHNIMKHMDARRQNLGLGLLADIAVVLLTRGQVSNTNFAGIAAQAYSQEFEAEADYVGLYVMARAGLPIANAPIFWRRMAAAHPANIRTNHAATHPSTSYRMVALEASVKEIENKRSKNEPLVPNMKDGKYQAPSK